MRALLTTLGVSALLVAAMAATAGAGLIAYEGFDTYAAGTQVESNSGVGLSGGTGWTDVWNIADAYRTNVTVVNQSLSYSSGNGDVQVSGGTKAMRVTGISQTAGNFVLAGRGVPSTTGTYYLSMLFYAPTVAVDSDFIQMGFDTAWANPRTSIGQQRSGGVPAWFARTGGSSTTYAADTVVPENTYFLVAKVSRVSGSTNYNRVDLFVNPTSLTEPGTPTVSRTGDSGIANLAYFAIREAFVETADTYYFDEIKIVDSWSGAIPEPATLALMGLGVVGVYLGRRLR
jgi:hypothetical protein